MKYLAILALIFLALASFIMLNKIENQQSKAERLVDSVLNRSAKVIKEKYGLRPCGTGAAMPGGPIQGLTLCFDTERPYNKKQLRELLIKSAREILNQININNEIKEFIKDPPFTLNNIQIIIYNSDKNGKEVYDPEISTAEISQGILTYQTVDPADTFNYKQEITETYEEALKALLIP